MVEAVAKLLTFRVTTKTFDQYLFGFYLHRSLSYQLLRLRFQLRLLFVGEDEDICGPGLGGDGDAGLLGQDIGLDESEQFGELGAAVGGGGLAASTADGNALAVDAGGRGVVQRDDGT